MAKWNKTLVNPLPFWYNKLYEYAAVVEWQTQGT